MQLRRIKQLQLTDKDVEKTIGASDLKQLKVDINEIKGNTDTRQEYKRILKEFQKEVEWLKNWKEKKNLKIDQPKSEQTKIHKESNERNFDL